MLDLFNSLNTIEDVETFITATSTDTDAQSRESTYIEYKQADQRFSNTNEIGKDVSAFANSEGGIIFYGITCHEDDRTKPNKISGLHHANIESLDRVINSHIHYPIKGIQKKLIPLHEPRIMLLYVPQSDESPHQNGDGKYYIRLATESRAMPHYLVELHFGKRRKPKLSVIFEPLARPGQAEFRNDLSPSMRLNLSILNSGKALGKYVRAIFLFTNNHYVHPIETTHTVYREYKILSNYSPNKKVWEFKNHPDVIHPTTQQKIEPFRFQYHFDLVRDPDKEEDNPILEWEVYAEEMEPQKGKIILTTLFARAWNLASSTIFHRKSRSILPHLAIA